MWYILCCSMFCLWFSHYQIIRMKFPNLSTRRLGTRGQSKYVPSVTLFTSGMIMCAHKCRQYLLHMLCWLIISKFCEFVKSMYTCYIDWSPNPSYNCHPSNFHPQKVHLAFIFLQWVLISVYYGARDSPHPLSLRYHYYGLSIKETSIYYRSVYSKKGLTRYITAINVTNTV